MRTKVFIWDNGIVYVDEKHLAFYPNCLILRTHLLILDKQTEFIPFTVSFSFKNDFIQVALTFLVDLNITYPDVHR